MARVVKDNEVASLVYYFSQIPDPRVGARCDHLLIDVLVITICAVLCGAQTCTDFEDFGYSKEQWLRKYLKLSNGIPSHDTFRRVLSIIDPNQLEKSFLDWVQAILGERKFKSLSLDGKSIAGTTHGGIGGRSSLHVVNVYLHEYGLCLAQIESNGAGGESTAALEILDQLDIKDTLVLADAQFATHAIAKKIRQKKGHYLVALKGNRPSYYAIVSERFEESRRLKRAETKETGHGRWEKREASVLYATDKNLAPNFFEQWPDVKTLIRIRRKRTFEDKRPFHQTKNEKTGEIKHARSGNQDGSKTKIMRTTDETAYYLSSKKMTPETALREVRKHWGIENGLHWILDVAFAEDDWLARAKRLSRNMSAIRKIGLNLIRSNVTLPKKSIRRHMKTAGWSDEILEKLVFGRSFDA